MINIYCITYCVTRSLEPHAGRHSSDSSVVTRTITPDQENYPYGDRSIETPGIEKLSIVQESCLTISLSGDESRSVKGYLRTVYGPSNKKYKTEI